MVPDAVVLLKERLLVDATIEVPAYTKNKAGISDPEIYWKKSRTCLAFVDECLYPYRCALVLLRVLSRLWRRSMNWAWQVAFCLGIKTGSSIMPDTAGNISGMSRGMLRVIGALLWGPQRSMHWNSTIERTRSPSELNTAKPVWVSK